VQSPEGVKSVEVPEEAKLAEIDEEMPEEINPANAEGVQLA
jgi:hypothetical protein